MLVSCVHAVAIISAVFCIICSLSMLVSDASGDHPHVTKHAHATRVQNTTFYSDGTTHTK